ncbi:dienelactone hydrolase [Nitriliruptoraceae bacterium ZYF776]|nr:dienelactone hydrolase [Profundirhabdus halotolerans]
MSVRPLRLPVDSGPVESVTAAVHAPAGEGPAVLLAPGAGGDLEGAGLVALAEVLAELGCTVVRANLPYREAGQRGAPRADRSVGHYAQLLAAARAEVAPDASWIVGGKSYGGRVASLGVAEGQIAADGLLFYGYPLHPPGKPEQLRTDHWPAIRVPTLFLQGSHDTFGTADEVRPHLTRLPRRATLVAVEGGDHSLDVAGTRAPDGVRRPATEVLQRLGPQIAEWLRSLAE